MTTLERAVEIAARAHAGQVDKAGQPYILHPLRLMLAVRSLHERMAAVLHDVVEDTSVTLKDLSLEGFPVEVLDAVRALTKTAGESRIAAAKRAAANPIARVVKLADVADNMDMSRIAHPGEEDYARLKEYEEVRALLLAMTRTEPSTEASSKLPCPSSAADVHCLIPEPILMNAGKKIAIIEAVCTAIDSGDNVTAIAAAKSYPLVLQANARRSHSILVATEVFVRDGFIDRYSGDRLVNPAVLRILSKELPSEFPFHKNWKMDETHPAYWELVPTVDHVDPVARGGTNFKSNLITTSMLRNSAKANWTLKELDWHLHPAGDISQWDGLTRWLIKHVDSRSSQQNFEPYVIQWCEAARKSLP